MFCRVVLLGQPSFEPSGSDILDECTTVSIGGNDWKITVSLGLYGNHKLDYDEYVLAATHETTANTSAPDIVGTTHKTPKVKGERGYPD
jgi:hypothetical protein